MKAFLSFLNVGWRGRGREDVSFGGVWGRRIVEKGGINSSFYNF